MIKNSPYSSEEEFEKGMKLGLLLDKKKLTIKSVGIFNREDDENGEQSIHRLNGLGLSKTTQSEVLTGIFKSDMIIKDFSYQQNSEPLYKNYGRNLHGSFVKEMLTHEHMKSLSYQHNYLYFP